ncbi:uncharacterized protein FIESC28_04636 [Fusarium coffeatum]|uniref:SNF2 N-terminal domain-containing protein n=1 Tax=Fusarium coffeatum TaxID=231269 RepID=A0A366RYK0_9HYPO|nr:uncharacterized protein FIESC28_04636 [Fusarium coffeatum]RBR22131.1 hypothetical protein FIESC28_04636 [Fusarium coffeatum]
MAGPRERRTFGTEPLTLDQAQVYLGSEGVRLHPSLGHRARHTLNRIKADEILSKEEYTGLKEDVKLLQHGTLGHHNGVVATTPVGATPLLVRDAFKPDLIIIDEAAMMDEASILILIAHYSPKAWIVTGDIAQKPPHLTMEHDLDIGTLQSTVATLFAILRHFPTRFRSYTETPDKPEEFIWGFSHEDWFRANTEKDILGGNWEDKMAGSGENLAKKLDIAEIFGDDIAGAYSYDPNTGEVNDHLGVLAEYITSGVSSALRHANPSTDPFEYAKEQRMRSKLPPPVYPSPQELELFREILLKRAHVAYDKSLPREELETLYIGGEDVSDEERLAAGQHRFQTGAQDLTSSDEVDAEGSSERKEFLGMQNLLGEFLPPHDLEKVCEKLGLPNWRNLERNPEHAPGKKLKPNQLIADAYDLHLKLESIMHAALLTSECGISKTNTMLACLRISTQFRIDRWNSGLLFPDEDERVFKPTLYMCPSSVLDQTYQEIAEWWGGYFRIYTVFDQLAKAHNDPMTAKTIFLCPYNTFTRRFSTDDGEAVGASKAFRFNREPPIDDGQNDLAPEDLELQAELDEEEAVPLRKLALKGVQLYRLILDEGHAVKNVQSTMNRLLQQLDYKAIMLASATVLSNHVRDFYGYIELIWDKDLPFDWNSSTSMAKADTWYDIGTWKRLTQGQDTEEIESGRIYRDTEDEDTDKPVPTARQIRRNQEYTEHIKKTGEPIFLMNPKLFYSFSSASQHSPAFAQTAIRAILRLLCVRRSMLSVMTLPDGTTSWPGKGIPPLHCNEVEFNLPVLARNKVHEAIRRLHSNLTTTGPRRKTFKSSHGARVNKPKAQLNGNALRRMCLASTNVHNLKTTSPIVRTTKLLKDVTLRKIMSHTIKDSTREVHEQEEETLDSSRRGRS